MALSVPHQILVRGPNWVGDLVMATPGLRALRGAFPAARIVVQLRPGLEGVLSACPHVDEIIPVRSYHRGLAAMVREGAGMRRSTRFDLGVCIPESFSAALLQRIAGVRRVVGYAGGSRGALIHHKVAVPAGWGERRLVARERFVLGLMEAIGCAELGTQLELFTTAAEDARVEDVLRERGVGPGDRLVVLAPGASYGPSKCWPAASYARVGDALQARGHRIALLGAASEACVTASVAQAMNCRPLDLAGVLCLAEAKALIRRASLMVCNDAGARHMAVAFGVPSIVFLGPTSLEKTNLNLGDVEVLETDDTCRPCYERVCPIDHRCMTGIDPEQVIRLACKRLGIDP